MKILIRTDASVAIGTGHMMRCLTLAHQYRELGCHVIFWMENVSEHYVSFIQKEGYEVTNEIQFADICIVDHYGLDHIWERRIRPYVQKLIVIDDLANRLHDCDILLDQNLVPFYEKRYDDLVPPSCIKLVGPSYLIMRKEFIDVRHQRNLRTYDLNSLLVFMGGTDPTDETLKVLKALERYNPFSKVHLVVGNGNPQKHAIALQAEQSGYFYHEQIQYMASLMSEVDYSLGAGGSTMWERCFLGLPSTSTIVAENQIEATKEAVRLGVVRTLGWHEEVTISTYINELKNIEHEKEQLRKISEKALKATEDVSYPHPLVLLSMEGIK